MKANELRIGNYTVFSTPKLPINIRELKHAVSAIDIVNYENGKIMLNPIPLTEEWLVKFGFQTDLITWWNDKLKELHISIGHYAVDRFYLCTSIGLVHSIQIEYVHQLQNLFYALCGEELTINP